MKKIIGCFVCFFLAVFCVRADINDFQPFTFKSAKDLKEEKKQQERAKLEEEVASGKRVRTKHVDKNGHVYYMYCVRCVSSSKSANSSKSAKNKKKKKKNNFKYMTIDERLKSFQK